MTTTPKNDPSDHETQREFRRLTLRSSAMVFGAFVVMVLALRLLDVPRPIGVLMGGYLAASSFFAPTYPGTPAASLQRRVLFALILGLVGGALIALVDQL